MNNLEHTVGEIILGRLGIPQQEVSFSPSTPLFTPISAGGLELDSLAGVEIISALAYHFDLPLDDIEPSDFKDVSALAAYLRRHGVSDDVQS